MDMRSGWVTLLLTPVLVALFAMGEMWKQASGGQD